MDISYVDEFFMPIRSSLYTHISIYHHWNCLLALCASLSFIDFVVFVLWTYWNAIKIIRFIRRQSMDISTIDYHHYAIKATWILCININQTGIIASNNMRHSIKDWKPMEKHIFFIVIVWFWFIDIISYVLVYIISFTT